MFDSSDPVFRSGRAAADAGAERRERERSSPEAERRRDASRASGRRLNAGEARASAERHFASWLDVRGRIPTATIGNRRIAGYAGDAFAMLEDDRGQPDGVVFSTEPLLTETGGDPLDLRLERRDGHYEPRTARVPVRLPQSADRTVEMPGLGIGIDLVDGQAAAAVQSDGSLVYPNVYGAATDTDYIVKPTPLGVEALWQLRSPDSPESVVLRYVLPEDGALAAEGAGPTRTVAIKRAGTTVARVLPAVAVDAAGTPLPVEMTVAGDRVILRLEHRDADVEYPLLLDPESVTEGWSGGQFDAAGTSQCGYVANRRVGWSFENSPNGGAGFLANCHLNVAEYGWGLWTSVQGGQWYADGSFGQHNYRVPPNTHITALAIAGINHASYLSRAHHGIFDDACGCWLSYQELATDTMGHYAEWSPARLNAPAGVDNSRIVIGFRPIGSGARPWGTSGARGVSVALSDRHAPQTRIRDSWPSQGWSNSRYGSVSYEMTDAGLGLKAAVVQSTAGQNASVVVNQTCAGPRVPCPEYHNTDGMQGYGQPVNRLPFDREVFGEGVTAVRVRAQDAAGNVSYSDSDASPQSVWYDRYDKTSPSVGFSGTLWNARTDVNGRTYEDSDTLTITATDPNPNGGASSGVKRVDVFVDGDLVQPMTDVPCPANSCSLSRPLTISLNDIPEDIQVEGIHDIQVNVYDWAGNPATTRTFSVFYDRNGAREAPYEEPAPADPGPSGYGDATQDAPCVPGTDAAATYCGEHDATNLGLVQALAEPPLVPGTTPIPGTSPLPSLAPAPAPPVPNALEIGGWGIADEHGDIFGESRYQALALPRARKIIPYNLQSLRYKSPRTPEENRALQQFDSWWNSLPRDANGALTVEPLVSFTARHEARARTKSATKHPSRRAFLPSVEGYMQAVNSFRAAYPHIREYTAWNEPNLPGQPTRSRADRAGEYYNAFARACSDPSQPEDKKCKVAAGDFADYYLTESYLKEYKKAAGSPKLWAYHAYAAGRYRDLSQWAAFLKATSGDVWLTEQGAYRKKRERGSYYFQNESKAEGDLKYLLDTVVPSYYSGQQQRVKRFYYYQFLAQSREGQGNRGTLREDYDTGLLNHDGTLNISDNTTRSVYCVYKRRTNPSPTDPNC